MARFLKLLIALALVPFLAASVRFFWLCFERTTDWPSWELGLLGAGVGVAALAFVFLPRPTWLYVFGHESTHALAVWCSGGRVLDFRVSGKGGQVVADRNSPLIALAPYVFPFFPVVTLIVWLGIGLVWPEADRFRDVFWVVWGVAWGFHAAFTLSVLKTAQPDFASQGYVFSFVIIALGNLWLSLALFCFWLRPLPVSEGVEALWEMTRESYGVVAGAAWAGAEWILQLKESR